MLCVTTAASGPTVSIDPTVTYRTIEGLGYCGPPSSMYQVREGPFLVDAEWEPFAETLITYVGMSMSRGFDTKSCEFNPSPGEYVVHDALRAELERQRLLQHIADSCNETYRFCPNVFSPPGWMKWSGECTNERASTYPSDTANSLKPEHYADFGALCSAFIRIAVDSFSVPVYAFSPQNEPYFNEPYASCSYKNGTHYAQMLRFVGPAVERASPSTLIYGVEHMLWTYPSWEMAVLRDPEAEPYFDRFAYHGATSDVNVDTSQWPALTRTYPRDQWQSEFNWQKTDYDTCFGMASSVLNRLGDGGNMTGYMAGGGRLWWDPTETGGAKTPAFHMNAQFMRFIRPGMTRVKAASDVPLLRVIAFKNDTRESFSVVMLNGTTDELRVTLSSTGTIPDSLEMRTTSSTQGFVEGPLQDGSSPVTVPARGIVSLGFRIRGPQPVKGQPVIDFETRRELAWPRGTPREAVHLFDLQGRTLARNGQGLPLSRRPALVVQRDGSGNARVMVRGISARP